MKSSVQSFFSMLGRGLAHVGVAIVKGSVAISSDPRTVQIVAQLAGHPEIGAAVIAGANAVALGDAVVENVKAGDVASAAQAGAQDVSAVKATVDAVKSITK